LKNWEGFVNEHKAELEDGMEENVRTFIIAVANHKGGVGKTTTVLSLGGALTKLGKYVLLVDLDIQANLTISLGLDPHKVNRTISDVFFYSTSLVSVSQETNLPGLDIVPADKGMEMVESFLALRQGYENILSNSLMESRHAHDGSSEWSIKDRHRPLLLDYYDYLIFDCPPSVGAVTLNALVASNMLVIPTQPEYYSVYSVNRMLAKVDEVRKKHNPKLNYRLLITMIDRRNRIHCHLCDEIQDHFSQSTFRIQIGVDTQLRESVLAGLPITHYRTHQRSALQYEALAEEIIELSQTPLPVDLKWKKINV